MDSVVQHTSVPAASLFEVISLRQVTQMAVRDSQHTTVSVTNGVGVQLRGRCASEGPWLEKRRAKPAASRAIETGDC